MPNGSHRAAGLHSLPARLGVRGALQLAAGCHAVTFAALVAFGFATPELGTIYFAGLVPIGGLLAYQHALVSPTDLRRVNDAFFKVNAVITLRVVDPVKAVIEVSNYVYQTSQFAQTTLRSVLGEVDLDELLAHRETLNLRIQTIIDGHTAPFGLKVVSVEVKQVDMPENMLRAMAKQAEAERERRAKIIHAEGEFNAAAKLVDAAALMATQPMTLQLRYLQTLTEIGVEKNTTIVFPLPMELMNLFNQTFNKPAIAPASKPDTEPNG